MNFEVLRAVDDGRGAAAYIAFRTGLQVMKRHRLFLTDKVVRSARLFMMLVMSWVESRCTSKRCLLFQREDEQESTYL